MSHFKNNKAAWLTAVGSPLKVGPGPIPNPAEKEVVIKVAYSAVNPIDVMIQSQGSPHFSFPTPLGTDVSGTVVALGSEVTQFSIGQRVSGHCDGLLTKNHCSFGFQTYATCVEIVVCPIPRSLPLASAAVLPLCVDTAATGLFHILGLPLPAIDPKEDPRMVLIWGGSSSVGSCAIQLARAAGFNVATTASARNHEYVKSLGAQHVFDYHKADLKGNILELLKPGDFVFDCMGYPEVLASCEDILSKIGGGTLPTVRIPFISRHVNVQIKFVNGLHPALVDPALGNAVWLKYLAEALKLGKFQPKPDPHIIKGGLEKVQDGIDLLARGVSATKIVIEIDEKAA